MAHEVHVGDIGTKYKVRIEDEGGTFDPSGAVSKTLIFKLPTHGVVEVDADVESEGGSPPTASFLTYTVTTASVFGSPPLPFHAAPGVVSVQARLEYGDGSVFTTNKRTTDDDGRLLKIYPNLDS